MARLPSVNSREVIKAFESFGWRVTRQSSSHIIMVREGHIATLSVPNHDPVAKGTLRSLIRTAGLTVDEFVAAL
jgi:predicted RNA binding protein YcfA (HicA-like mRNA interferase family)